MKGERLKFKNKKDQKYFFKKAKDINNFTWEELANFCNINKGTFKFWYYAKYTPPKKVVYFLSKKLNIKIPKHKILEPYWYITEESSRKGAINRNKKYGPFGTKESRRKGGLTTQKRIRENPKLYKKSRLTLRKKVADFKINKYLAELVGIILGDGGVTSSQITITLNKKDDWQYSFFVSDLIKRVLGEKPSRIYVGNTVNLMISGIEYIEKLSKIGIFKGNKVKRQVKVPDWIIKNNLYSKRCIRGLMDTDGGVYFHNHIVQKKEYINFGICFTNKSIPLSDFMFEWLDKIDSKPKRPKLSRVYIYNLDGIKKYFKEIGTSNPKHLKRLKKYLSLNKR
jgi:hypothetical protein